MRTLLILASSLLAVISPVLYIRAILSGEAKPHRTTRFILLVISVLTTASLIAQGDRVAVWLAGIAAIQSIFIFAVSIKRGMGGWEKKDLLCMAIALLGIVLWQTTNNPALALYAAIAADFTGMIPALIKTYHFPETEIWTFYFLDVFAALFSVLAVESWTMEQTSYPIYILLINIVMVVLILRKHFPLVDKSGSG